MPYYLWKAVLARTPKIEISHDEYERTGAHWRYLLTVLDIEEEWDCLIQNYIELEMELLRSAMQGMVLDHEGYHEFQDARLRFSRRLSNLLTCCRSYLDHAPHHLQKLPAVGLADLYRSHVKSAYDESFAYRFMDALRNYAQHRGWPLHGATFDSRWVEREKSRKGALQYSVIANVNLNKIRGDNKFKKLVLDEVATDLDQIDVGALVREYIEKLGKVHDALRKELDTNIVQWKETVRYAIAKYADANEGNVLGLALAKFSERGVAETKIGIFDDALVRLERLTGRNGSLVNLRRRFVTNEIITR